MKKSKLNKNNLRIIVTGGGTGGHVKPLMAVVTELKKHKTDILYVGSGFDLEKKEAEKHKIKYKKILTGKYRRYFDIKNFLDVFKVAIGFIQALFIIFTFLVKLTDIIHRLWQTTSYLFPLKPRAPVHPYSPTYREPPGAGFPNGYPLPSSSAVAHWLLTRVCFPSLIKRRHEEGFREKRCFQLMKS